MSESSVIPFGQLVATVQGGDASLLGQVLERYRDYLKLLTRLNLGEQIQGKVADSDVVQETFIQTQKNFAGFRGSTEAELLAWLRAIMAAQVAQQVRYYHRDRRDVRLERRLAEDLERSAAGIAVPLFDSETSPSMRAVRHERQVLLADALARIKPEHREVIILRSLKELSFAEVAQRMGRSVKATKSLWVRALASLRRLLRELTDELV